MTILLHTLWGLAMLAIIIGGPWMLAVLRSSAKPTPEQEDAGECDQEAHITFRTCRCCNLSFPLTRPDQHICADCAADNILRDIERDEKLNEPLNEEPPRSQLKFFVQGAN